MYPPGVLHKDIYDVDKIKRLLPTHDDVYFWAMTGLNNTKIQLASGHSADIHFIEDSQECGLININRAGGNGISLEDAYNTYD